MKKLLLGTALPLAMVAGASAADLPGPGPAPAYQAPPPVYSWTGFYIGGDVGARSAVVDPTVTAATLTTSSAFDLLAPGLCNYQSSSGTAIGSCPGNTSLDNTAFRAGVYGGYNFQFGQWVAGIEGDWGGASRSRAISGQIYPGGSSLLMPGTGDASFSVKTTWDASARGRVGFLLAPNVLAYATGGASWLHVEATSVCDSVVAGETCAATGGFPGLTPAAITNSTTRLGWTVGGGLEANVWGNWLIRGEYRYADYGTWSNTDVRACVAAGGCFIGGEFSPPAIIPIGSRLAVSYDTHVQTNTLKFGLAYKF